MRPFVWGAMLLLTVAAFAFCPSVLYQSRGTAEAVAVESSTGKVWVMTTAARGKPVPSQVARKLRPIRGEDPSQVLYHWEVKGELRLSQDEAFESALENARCQVMHDLGLTVPPSREVIREKLKTNEHMEQRKKFLDDSDAFRVSLDLDLTRGTYLELSEAERAERVTHRMKGAARGLGILVAALAAVAGYIRLDELTKGYYTGRLRMLAVLLVAAATVFISRV